MRATKINTDNLDHFAEMHTEKKSHQIKAQKAFCPPGFCFHIQDCKWSKLDGNQLQGPGDANARRTYSKTKGTTLGQATILNMERKAS